MADTSADSFQAVRPRLFGIAYRVLDSAADADDVVQDVWMRWHRTDRSSVRDASGFLATTTRRLALNVAQSARVRHEAAAGSWPSEPVDRGADPARIAEQRDQLEHALLMLLAKLSATERAAYVLRHAFAYPYRRIAQLLGVSEVNARQHVARARGRLGGNPRRSVGSAELERFRDVFMAAAQTGELTQVEGLLLEDPLALDPLSPAEPALGQADAAAADPLALEPLGTTRFRRRPFG